MTRPRLHKSALMSTSGRWICSILVLILLIGSVGFGEEKEKPKPADAEKKEQATRLIDGFLRELFPQKQRIRNPRGPVPMGPRDANDTDDESGNASRDLIDSRAPRDTKVEQLLQAAELAVQKHDWKSAIELFQRLLDQPEDSLHRQADGQWLSVRQSANQMLGKLPEATLTEYRSQFGGLAQQQLLAARRSGLVADYVNVATRFFHTPAGYEAAHYLAAQHFDRSEFGLAAHWFGELAASPALIARQDPWLLQASHAMSRSGDVKGAKTLLDRLSHGPNTLVTLGSGTVKASDWLNQTSGEVSPRTVALSNWTQLYGTAARVGTALGGDAILSPNWSLPLTSSHVVRNSVKWLVHDLQDQQRSLILAAAPLVIDGKVIYRDLRGVRSVDIETGRTMWESVEGVSPERILGGLPSQQIDPQEAWRFQLNLFQNTGDYQGMSAEYSPLASLMFRDGAYGLISSDGKQLFVIEDHGILSRNQPGQHWGWDGNADQHDPYGLSWKTNRLVSYDLKTGRSLWSIGGNESRESFDLPLAGSYFFGTPAIDGDELFLVAGKGDDIRLWSLDRRTGKPHWSQLIAYSDTKIDLDIARRWITSQVAVGDGIIVCPSTVGWLVAIDRMRQSVLWAHRYAPRQSAHNPDRNDAGGQLLQQKELNAQWCPSAPIISGSYVVYTPQEESMLICLNAVDGRQLWEKPKENGLYLAGVFNQKAIIVSETEVIAYQLADGQTAWTSKLDDGVRPSGRGVSIDDRFYLPLSNGELRSIDLSNGDRLSQTYVGARQPPLGNLAMHQGKLVSLSPTGMKVFGQREAVLAEIQRRLANDPNDAWALLRSSEIHLLNHEFDDALSLLRRIAIDRLTSDERTRQHTSLMECLSTVIHRDVLHRGDELAELGRLAASPPERLLFHELTAEKLLAEQKPIAAFEIFSQLAEDDGDAFVVRTDDRHVSARRTVWLSGRMSEIWSATSEAERRSIDERITALIVDASEKSAAACHRIATLFAFHPAAIGAQQRFVEWLVEAKDLSGARLVLQQLADHPEPPVAAKATERLARLMIQSKLPADAVYYYGQLESKFAKVKIQGDETGASLVAQVRATNELQFESQPKGIAWPNRTLRLEQSVMNYTPPSHDVVLESTLPFFDKLGLESYQNEQRLALESVGTGQVEWMIPLRSAIRATDEGYLSTNHIGHQLYFVNRGVLHAVSPIEKRLLWSKSLEEDGDGNSQGRHSSRPAITSMISPGSDEASQSLLLQRAFNTGHLAVVQPTYLCLYGRRSLSVLDPRTGDELWKREALPMNAQVVGNRNTLFIIAPGKNETECYRASDGKPLNIPDVGLLLNRSLTTHGQSLLLFEPGAANSLEVIGIRRSKTAKPVLRLYDPIAKTTAWQIEFPARTVVSLLDEEEVVAVLADGHVQRIDIGTGRVTAMDPIISKKNGPLLEKFLLADGDRIYLVVNSLDRGNQSYGENLASIRVNGIIFAWDRNTNRHPWAGKKVKDQNLVVDRFSTMPALLFVSRTWKQQGKLTTNLLSIEAIHKQTGKMLIDAKVPSAYNGFHAVSINAEEPSIDLKSYNLRMRLVPEDAEEAPAKPAGQGD